VHNVDGKPAKSEAQPAEFDSTENNILLNALLNGITQCMLERE